MKKYLLVLCFIMIMTGCGHKSVGSLQYDFDENGSYVGFKELPKNYSAEQAIKEGCYVSKDLEEVGGVDKWAAFVEDSAENKNSSIRIMSIYDDEVYYEDLFFVDGCYNIFDSSSDDLTAHKYKYLLDLSGTMPSAVKDSRYVVLTDDKDLTFNDVFKSFISGVQSFNFKLQSFNIKLITGLCS